MVFGCENMPTQPPQTKYVMSWWRHQMQPFSALLALCAGNSPPGEFPAQRPVMWSFDVFFDLRLNKRLSKQSWGCWFETPPWSLRRQCNATTILAKGVRLTVAYTGPVPTPPQAKCWILNWRSAGFRTSLWEKQTTKKLGSKFRIYFKALIFILNNWKTTSFGLKMTFCWSYLFCLRVLVNIYRKTGFTLQNLSKYLPQPA